METLLLEVRNNVALVTLNRPDALNSLNTKMREELHALWQQVNEDDAIRAVILTGSGRAFCAGRDIKEAVQQNQEGVPGATGGSTTTGTSYLPLHVFKPMVAAVNGAAAGGGLGLALACDIVIASEQAVFTSPFAARGTLNSDVLGLLVKKAPLGWASWMALSGARVDAQTAARVGLVNEVLPAGDLIDRATEMAERIIANSYISVLAVKEKVHMIMEGTMNDGVNMTGPFAKAWAEHGEAKEGFAAFAEKRTAQFS